MERDEIAYLRSAVAIRERCRKLFDLACADRLSHFRCDLSQLDPTAAYVLQVMQENYPNGTVPFHSRWRHFEGGNAVRLKRLEEGLQVLNPIERAKAKSDLAIVSVLLDAGAGATWQYREAETGEVFCRSEGLAVASFHLFCNGQFSSDARKQQVDAIGLQRLTQRDLERGFQVSADNPLVGVQGRVELLQRLGQVLCQFPPLFGAENPRPGNLVDYLCQQAVNQQLSASKVLEAVLQGFGDIWAGRLRYKGCNLGDVWVHAALAQPDPKEELFPQLVPFHKLSQWLTYSLLEPLQELGLEITDLDQLTGLPEYRNGGLCLDLGLLQMKDPALLHQVHSVDSEVIVEWRALTVILLDRIADRLRQQLGMTPEQLPLVKVLQGGTWTAGRKIAADLRPGGIPPLQIRSDGTVF